MERASSTIRRCGPVSGMAASGMAASGMAASGIVSGIVPGIAGTSDIEISPTLAYRVKDGAGMARAPSFVAGCIRPRPLRQTATRQR